MAIMLRRSIECARVFWFVTGSELLLIKRAALFGGFAVIDVHNWMSVLLLRLSGDKSHHLQTSCFQVAPPFTPPSLTHLLDAMVI